jgi:anti-sigma factor RsiW
MSGQHLSDEAIAAFADGKLSGLARDRAVRHTRQCAECHHAVAGQREAVWALRAAPAPGLPSGLMDRLRGLPETTPIQPLPTVLAPDGTAMLSVFAPSAALVPVADTRPTGDRVSRARHVAGAAALLTTFGVLAAGSGTALASGGARPGGPQPGPPSAVLVHHTAPGH